MGTAGAGTARVGTAAPAVQAERTGAPDKPGVGLTGWSSSAFARAHGNSGLVIVGVSPRES
jgi:hypothetical protein